MFRTAHRAISKSAVHTDPSWQSSIPREIEVICQEENDFDSVLMAPYGGVGQSVERAGNEDGLQMDSGVPFWARQCGLATGRLLYLCPLHTSSCSTIFRSEADSDPYNNTIPLSRYLSCPAAKKFQ
jgi:hypothetical protein